ncbi:MAG: PDZ domain-containing protein [Gemmatimonadaceae bacterium]
MMNVMYHSIKKSSCALAMAFALVPLAATTAHGQQAGRTRARVCVNDRCVDDSTHVIVVRLQDQIDSLQHIYLGQPISPAQRDRMKGEMEAMIRQLMDLQQNAVALGLQQAEESIRRAMADPDPRIATFQVAPPIPDDAAPKGWIGLTFVGAPVTYVQDSQYFVRFLDYPEVESVEPASPAEHAGILRGDLLLAFNGQDVTTQAISKTHLLRPDHKVVVRLERNGQPRDFSLVVAKAPQSYAARIGDFAAPRAPAAPDAVPAPARGPRAVFYGRSAPAPVPTPPGGSWFSFNFDGGVAGAELSTINADLARNLNLGVDHGVIVLKAPDGTPAARSGLKAGDIIVQAAGQDIASVRDFRRVLERHSADASVQLQVVRDKHTRTINFNND